MIKITERTSFHLYDEQIKFINDKKYELKSSRSEILRKLLNYFMKNTDKFEKIIQEELKNCKKEKK